MPPDGDANGRETELAGSRAADAQAANRRLWLLRGRVAEGRYLEREVAREVARAIMFSRDL